MKSENFELLREAWPELAELGGFAEAPFRPCLAPPPLQPGPPTQPPQHLQSKPLRRPGRVASVGGLNASDRHPLHAGSGLSDKAYRTAAEGKPFDMIAMILKVTWEMSVNQADQIGNDVSGGFQPR
ncbi:MAG: hypothetical protein V3R83_05720 [Gammaproteobacteria bacterium]